MGNYNSHNDHELLELLKSADQAAFAEIYDRYFSILFTHADTKLQDEENARDIVQDVFVRLWEKRENLQITSNLPGYLFQAVRNQILDFIKHQKVATRYSESFYESASKTQQFADHLIREKQFAAMIEREIAALPPRMRQVFELRRIENLSNKEVAEKMNITESTAANQMKKAVKVLRLRIGLFIVAAVIFDKLL